MFGYFTSFDVIILRIDKLSYGYDKKKPSYVYEIVRFVHSLFVA
jgi:hypothetical protein